MRTLNMQELNVVSGAGQTAVTPGALINAFVKALAANGISLSLNSSTDVLTIGTAQGSKAIKLPQQLVTEITTLTAGA